MNLAIEAVGLFAGACIFGAMAVKKLIIIKILLLLSAVAFLAYGILWVLPAGIIINAIGVCIGVYGLTSAIRATKRLDI